ncbi:MAG: repair protein RecO protein [Microgenomates group bacterium GW2011_GWC1_43_13]|uniref:DNA repair protein RecO n=2 Tax=Candidatus Woeseibacteriota TaxID=1752722 RepID=A0A837IAX8_9BACT|nr:MAG: repair protein RecO protein [Microgenomates group bacterium GW2011_GWC1_43_13]KKT32270.1 MAG: repair protein RecO protein [Candidatus Woesebacteria bacterium GW2011_GWB1_44_11]KKT53713.1 MAG: repair protein RecO protein [Candidatus Woesebacteria bacterium GW2011_GWA1_44_23]OGM83530.1 MAG: DNA repair protein RecO [Candidatus Woesebacteria bacterium RIFOXYC1_FULL_43_18]
MKPRAYTSEGIVIARRNFGEADRILVLYTKNFGKVSLIAKGIRRPKSKKRGHVEVFNKIKFQAARGRGLGMITEAEVIEDFAEIRKSLRRISLAYYLMEVVGRITHDGEEKAEVYDLLLETLSKLKSTKMLKKLRLDFITSLLITLGYWPDGKPLPAPDEKLDEVIERAIYSKRVGKRMIQ